MIPVPVPTGLNRPSRATQPTPRRLRVRGTQARSADDILGLSRSTTTNMNRSLDMEIEAYLLDPQTGTGSLMFWQVCLFLAV